MAGWFSEPDPASGSGEKGSTVFFSNWVLYFAPMKPKFRMVKMSWRARHFVPDPPAGGGPREEDVHDT